jgi:hypothetical protein
MENYARSSKCLEYPGRSLCTSEPLTLGWNNHVAIDHEFDS